MIPSQSASEEHGRYPGNDVKNPQREVCVDTRVQRVSKRLGLIGPKVNADKAHTVFAKIAPPDWVYGLHVGMILHGRQICHAQKPKCGQCPLYVQCAYVGSVNPQEIEIS